MSEEEDSADQPGSINLNKRNIKATKKQKKYNVEFDPLVHFYEIIHIKEHSNEDGVLKFRCTITEDPNLAQKYNYDVYKKMKHKHREVRQAYWISCQDIIREGNVKS